MVVGVWQPTEVEDTEGAGYLVITYHVVSCEQGSAIFVVDVPTALERVNALTELRVEVDKYHFDQLWFLRSPT